MKLRGLKGEMILKWTKYNNLRQFCMVPFLKVKNVARLFRFFFKGELGYFY